MKILLISDYFQPKIGYAKVQVVRELIEMGHQVKILTSDRYFPFHDYEKTVKKILGKRIRKPGLKRENGFLVERKPILFEAFTRVFISDLYTAIEKYKPDQIIVVGIATFTCFQVAQLKNKLKFKLVIADSHLPSELNSGNIFIKKLFYFFFRLFFIKAINSGADKVIALQDKSAEVIKTIYGVKKNILVIPNGTDTKLFKFSSKSRKSIRKELTINKNDFMIIYTGKIIKQKGIEILFKAFKQLYKKNKNIHLLLIGSGPNAYIQECFSLVDENCKSNIHLLGFKNHSELFKYYSAADIAVWPLQESLAMNDAAACSLPFIANSTMGDKTRISNNNAFLYTLGNTKSLVNKIRKLIDNKELRIKMGKNGRSLMTKKLSWKIVAKGYLC